MKNWVYYMQEGLKNMWIKKPKKKIKPKINKCKCKSK
jgi:hypothetical protein